MARKVLKYLNAYRRGIILPSNHSKFDHHEDFSSSSSSSSSSDEDIDDKFAKTSALHSRAKVNNNDTQVIHPVLPLTVYDQIKEAVGIMDRPGWPNGGRDERDLTCCETWIGVTIDCFRQFLPAGWKYERDNARSLIAGYDRVFNDGRWTFIV